MKIVLDTNVFISGLMFPESVPGRIVKSWKNSEFDLVLSEFMLKEIEAVLNYPKIQKRIHWSKDEISRFILILEMKSVVVNIHKVSVHVPRDFKDNPVLAALVSANADYLVTGDNDLLELKTKYRIVTPREFINLL